MEEPLSRHYGRYRSHLCGGLEVVVTESPCFSVFTATVFELRGGRRNVNEQILFELGLASSFYYNYLLLFYVRKNIKN